MTPVTPDDGEAVVLTPEEAEREIARFNASFPEIRENDPESVTRRMTARLDKATNIDELFDSLEGKSSDALIGRSFQLNGVEWQRYESQRGPIPLAIVDAIDIATGEAEEFVTTGSMLVAFLRKAQLLGAFPFTAKIVGKKTNSGQTALNFERA